MTLIFPAGSLGDQSGSYPLQVSSNLAPATIPSGVTGSTTDFESVSFGPNPEKVATDGNHFNNKLENLCLICPNCHALLTIRRK